jgi:DNA-binding MarR family transcriptional regulator
MVGIDRLEKAVQYLRREVSEEFPAQQLLLFITVGKQEGVTQHHLAELLGMPSGSVSRNIRMMSQFADTTKAGNKVLKGFQLLDTRPDVEQRQRMAVFLTSKGKRIFKQLDVLLCSGDTMVAIECKTTGG